MIQLGWFLGRLCDSLLKAGLSLTKIVIKALVKNVLILLGLTAASSILGSVSTPLIISNEEMEYIMKIVKSLEYPGLL